MAGSEKYSQGLLPGGVVLFVVVVIFLAVAPCSKIQQDLVSNGQGECATVGQQITVGGQGWRCQLILAAGAPASGRSLGLWDSSWKVVPERKLVMEAKFSLASLST